VKNKLPFAASVEAESHIQALLLNGPPGLVAHLMYCLGHKFEMDGKILEQYESPFFEIGWYHEDARPAGTEIELGGMKMSVGGEALKMLAGKTLVSELVEVGVPFQSSRSRRMLLAKPLTNDIE
jgi:hypothetical protein